MLGSPVGLLLLAATALPPAVPEPDVLECTVGMSQSQDEGRLTTTQYDRSQIGKRFTFSSRSGEFVWPRIRLSIQYEVVQHGSTKNGLVAIAAVQGPASYSVKTLRVQSWAPVLQHGRLSFGFMLVDEDTVQTGFCS